MFGLRENPRMLLGRERPGALEKAMSQVYVINQDVVVERAGVITDWGRGNLIKNSQGEMKKLDRTVEREREREVAWH